MKTLIALSALTLASATIAQAPAHTGNRVFTNNDPYYVVCTCTNVNTGWQRQWMGTMHPQYEANGGSVPAGDLEFKIIKGHEYKRGDAGLAAPDQPMIVGWESVVRQASSNPMGSTDVYWSFNHTFMTGAKVDTTPGIRNPGVQIIPDMSVPLIDFGAEVQDGATLNGHVRRLAAAAANPAPVLITGDFAHITGYVGGENDFVPSSATNGVVSQHNVGSWMDGETMGGQNGYTHDQFGFSDSTASGASIVYQTSLAWQFTFVNWATFTTQQPSIAIQSDYGKRRQTPTALLGESLGAYHSDGISSAFTLNYTIQGGTTFANGTAIPLINFSPIEFPATIPLPVLPGQTIYIYLDPSDPLFGAIAASLAATLDANGNYRPDVTLQLAFPQLPAGLLGWYWSWQAVLVDQTLTAVSNTERRSIKIES